MTQYAFGCCSVIDWLTVVKTPSQQHPVKLKRQIKFDLVAADVVVNASSSLVASELVVGVIAAFVIMMT